MAKNRFINIDLNLLRTFIVLHQEKNARKAAERLFVSQPAISQALKKLRFQFDDPLFVKVPNGLAPTPYSEELALKVEPYLEGLSAILNHKDEFDPQKLDQEVTIALAPAHVFSLGSEVYRYFIQRAPNLRINLVVWGEQTFKDIEAGSVDLGMNYHEAQDMAYIQSLSTELITQISPAILVAKDHPLTKQAVTLENLANYQLLRLYIKGYNDGPDVPAVTFFKKYGYDITVGFSSEYPLVILDVVQDSDMFFISTDSFPIEKYPLLSLLPVEQLEESIIADVKSYCHPRCEKNPLTQWLIQSFKNIFETNKTNLD
ncbi:LysR family transcriptional regulator [Vibrio methylphosphonaticus]|uniref:LysR family transcriptional regulator n=1 Tax=Vibrio methylphosphonaticus TaxID=2946866 RepID=UPI00202A9EA3|nr:LysR family transcriptional regulator [Vibrio methylphosphonaticus]MCL9775267.1 LysR family transcriptional regulator [Vibrio methylphosphonaticus]